MKMKCALVAAFVSLALVYQGLAVLRPLFSAKPAVPTNGDLVMIGDRLVLRSARKPRSIIDARQAPKGKAPSFGQN